MTEQDAKAWAEQKAKKLAAAVEYLRPLWAALQQASEHIASRGRPEVAAVVLKFEGTDVNVVTVGTKADKVERYLGAVTGLRDAASGFNTLRGFVESISTPKEPPK